jgi:integrase
MSMRKRDYLFKRNGSQYWRVRFQMDGRSVEQSLKTTDRREAELVALPMIAEHKAKLLAMRPRLEPSWVKQYPPGLHAAPDGGRLFATERELHHLDANGEVTRREPNGGPGDRLVNLPLGAVIHFGNPTRPISELRRIGPVFDVSKMDRPTPPTKNGDDAILEAYLKHANITGHFEREARNVWALYKTLTDSKPLKDADRDDGRKLVKHFLDQEPKLKRATIEKKIGWLNAAVHFAMKENKLRFNPFSGILPKLSKEEKLLLKRQRRLPLDDADMKVIRANLKQLDASDQLLLRLLACTGMRLSEAFEIDSEQVERRCRFVIVGRKTDESERRVPLPTALLPFLPKPITGPLFPRTTRDPPDAASKRLARFLDDCGIVDPRKVTHSLRHRAQDRLRAAGCPEDVRWAILGHEEETVAAGYGEGFPVPLLRKWIDKIGC